MLIFFVVLMIVAVSSTAYVVTQSPQVLSNDLVDTDNDGVSDYDEYFIYDTDPFDEDTDGDGLSDSEEMNEYGTDPSDRDTDGDGLSDSEEINEYDTDPLTKDSDGDGFSDYAEIYPKEADSDGDGLYDYEEINEHDTDPLSSDTDGDGVADFAEINFHNTDPTDKDTDGDGLSDSEEISEYDTDPNSADTDEDGLIDSKEIEIRSDPMDYNTYSDQYSDYYAVTPVSNLSSDTMEGLSEPGDRLHLSNPLDSTNFQGKDSDGDGFPDRMESNNENLSADTKDIIVRVNWLEGYAPDTAAMLYVQDAFAESPVDDGTGIRLHFYIDGSVDVPNKMSRREYIESDYYQHTADVDDGTHNSLYIEDVTGSDVGGTATRGGYVIQGSGIWSSGHATMHELGHALGLSSAIYDGVDSRSISKDEYPSVMNYNFECADYNPECYTYSSGSGHNDWAHVERLLEDDVTTRTGSYGSGAA